MFNKTVLAGLVAALISTAALMTPATDRLHGLSLDSLHWLRQVFFAPEIDPANSPTAVIVIDEETYRREPFRNLPKVMWSKQLAEIINAVTKAEAKVIGLDIILPTSVEKHIRGFDRDLLIAMRRASQQHKIVLGKVQHQAKPIAPHAGQSFAVGHQKNIRVVNIDKDIDGIIRHLPLTVQAKDLKQGTRQESVMAVELAARAKKQTPTVTSAGVLNLGDKIIHGTNNNRLTLNFSAGSQTIPTYSFADIFACIKKGNTGFLEKSFKDKVVLIGTALDEEDRRLTSKRFITGPENFTHTARCHYPIAQDIYRADLVRDSVPGVFIHATAVNNILRNNALGELSHTANAAIMFIVALFAAFFALSYPPIRAGILTTGLALLWLVLATSVFDSGYVTILYNPILAAMLSFALLLGYRFTVSDKDKRYIKKVFSYYLPPAVIEKMTASDTLPTLGGEAKEVTILFSDIAGFSALSENLSASDVATFLNDYLSEMSDILESHGAFIEKFVADEITAVFGAPMNDPDHALHAVQAALACQKRLNQMQGAFGLPPDRKLAARTGINSGEMLVGNIGSHRRFTYAAMGDAANLGSRLEGANKFYGSEIMAGERTVELCGASILFREMDSIIVMGRDTAVAVFEPLGELAEVSAEKLTLKQEYEKALVLYRLGDFSMARVTFETLITEDRVSAVMSERCLNLLAMPPENWDGNFELSSK